MDKKGISIEKVQFMNEACKEANINARNNFLEGGPFGAVVVKDGKIIGRGKNSVLSDDDPTAHAEITAIKRACKYLNTHDLSGCSLYTTCYPCPMCLSAIVWSNINEVYYGNTKEDAAEIGFRDDRIYNLINNISLGKENKDILELHQMKRDETIKIFEEFKNKEGKIY